VLSKVIYNIKGLVKRGRIMAESIIAPSRPENYNNNDEIPIPSNQEINQKPKKTKTFLGFLKKKKEIIETDKTIGIKQDELSDDHFLDTIDKLEGDIQLNNKQVATQDKPETTLENIGYNQKTHKEIEQGNNINELRKALGIIKDKSEKNLKVEKFRDSLFNNSEKEEEIVTNLALEEKLGVKLDQPASEEVQHINIDMAIDYEVPRENYFILSDGRKLKSIRDLRNALENMSNSVFSSHVAGRKNDFANWVKKIMGETELSKLVRKCKTKELLLSMLVGLEKKEIEELIKLKEHDIIREHEESLKNISFIQKEREELNKEKGSIDKLKAEFESKLKVLQKKELIFNAEIQEAKLEKLGHKKKEQALGTAKKDYLEAIKKQSNDLESLRKTLLIQTQEYKEKIDQIFIERKKQLENEFNARFITLEKSLQERKTQLNKDYTERISRLHENEESFKKEQAEINSLYHTKVKEIKIEEEKIFNLQKELKEQELKLIERENEIRKNLAKLSKRLIESKDINNKLKRQIEIKNNLLLEIKEREAELKKRDRELQDGAFQKYLDFELKKLTGIETPKIKKGSENSEEIASLYARIDGCRRILDTGNIEETKQLYLLIRKKFYNMKLPKEEKEVLFDVIKELYADIQLEMI
jgi:hypothetical protein